MGTLENLKTRTKSKLTRLERLLIRVANLAVLLACTTRVIAYSEIMGPVRDSPGPRILSKEGELLTFYVILWGIASVFALWDFFKARYGYGATLYIPLMGWWAFSYFLAWRVSGWSSFDWMTTGIYTAAALSFTATLGAYLTVRYRNSTLVEENKVLRCELSKAYTENCRGENLSHTSTLTLALDPTTPREEQA